MISIQAKRTGGGDRGEGEGGGGPGARLVTIIRQPLNRIDELLTVRQY